MSQDLIIYTMAEAWNQACYY